MDMTSRAGKEARVAMEIAIDDFNTKTQKNVTLYTRNSKGKVVQAINGAINLIDTYKVEALLGLQTLEEVVSVGEISSDARIPTFSLLDSVPQWALDRFPFLVQASPSQFSQMKAFVAIMESCGWTRFSFIYEDINSASIQVIPHLMEAIKETGVVGLGSFFPDTGSQFHDFSTKFRTKFKIEQREEENNMPGIFAVQAYDATWIAALTLSVKNMSEQTFLEISLAGVGGEVQLVNKKPAALHVFHIINVVGKYYRQLGFWSDGLGFSEVINDRATYNIVLQNLGHIFWTGRPMHTPRGWAIPIRVKPLRVGVPTMAMFKKFVEVKYDHRHHSNTCTGYSIELFKETVRRLPYYMPYEFHSFTGTYDSLVEQVYLKNFDAVVGDVSVVSWRYEYAEFTHPYTETGLVMCYTTSLTSMLTVRSLIPKVTDCETLRSSNAVVGYDRGSQVASYLVNVLGFKHENIRSFPSPEEYAHALGKKEIAAVFLVAPYAKLFVTMYCKRFIAAGTAFGKGGLHL
ncbi:hypothetical protein L1987_49527 [Smallanthus sonchifolius]|uniref:Uncharacterized protein n=1 Tax=Smallanthus sonchifolius TaxID=185202 RepID=A0ACB9FVW5_9ASTR|nr:hypothetical protein L1987_49527 [Smallanthus sonchifolius]